MCVCLYYVIKHKQKPIVDSTSSWRASLEHSRKQASSTERFHQEKLPSPLLNWLLISIRRFQNKLENNNKPNLKTNQLSRTVLSSNAIWLAVFHPFFCCCFFCNLNFISNFLKKSDLLITQIHHLVSFQREIAKNSLVDHKEISTE